MNLFMYVVSVDVQLCILFVVTCVLLRCNVTTGGIGGMVVYKYCMWVEYSVVCYVRVFALCPLPLPLSF